MAAVIATAAAVFEVVGFVKELISLGEAVGFYSDPIEQSIKTVLLEVKQTELSIKELRRSVVHETNILKNLLTVSTVIQVRTNLPRLNNIPPSKIDILIKLLVLLKSCPSTIVLAIVVRFRTSQVRTGTLGAAFKSCDKIEDIILKIEEFMSSVAVVRKPKTSYLNIRMQGLYHKPVEDFACAILTSITTEVCGLDSHIHLENEETTLLEPIGCKTIVLLKPTEIQTETFVEHGSFKRVFIIGNTGTGKSTIGNALLPDQNPFPISKGVTGTVKVKRADYSEQFGDENQLLLTSVYDTPGLDDTNGLDTFYISCIKDYIAVEQRVSSFILAMDAENRLAASTLNSVNEYKELFGDKIMSMLIIVLTVDEPASKSDLENCIEDNWPSLVRLGQEIIESNVYCVSLHDLRERTETPSHVVIEEIRLRIRQMPLVMTQYLENNLKTLLEGVNEAYRKREIQVQVMKEDGFQKLDALTERYEGSGYTKMLNHRNFQGFLFQKASTIRSILLGPSNLFVRQEIIGRTFIEIKSLEAEGFKVWQCFKDLYRDNRKDRTLLWHFGKFLEEENLAVTVTAADLGVIRKHFYTYYQITIFDPMTELHMDLKRHLDNVLGGKMETLRPEIIDFMVQENIIRSDGSRRLLPSKSVDDWKHFHLRLAKRFTRREKKSTSNSEFL